MGTLWTALEGMPDRRTRKGRRYSLASIVMLSLSAMLSGANDLVAIYRWGRRLTPKALAHLRDAVLTLIRKRRLKPKPAREAFAANPKAAIRAIMRA
jgi:hypothetical protein